MRQAICEQIKADFKPVCGMWRHCLYLCSFIDRLKMAIKLKMCGVLDADGQITGTDLTPAGFAASNHRYTLFTLATLITSSLMKTTSGDCPW